MKSFQEMTLNELYEAQEEIKDLIEKRKEETKSALLNELKEKAESLGIDFEDIIGANSTRRSGKKSKAKYRNPSNESQTWSGSGRQPKWVKEQLDAGKSLDTMLIS